MSSITVKVAIVGSGPAGLSAAGRAAALGLSHILFESGGAHAITIQRYQKGKHVMAEPALLDLRSDMAFEEGKREVILESWQQSLAAQGVNIKLGAEVTGISGQQPNFLLMTKDGSQYEAEHVILAIGVQGKPRQIGAPGDDHPAVQYQLDDPAAYSGEHIVVVGAGDSAIENALALAAQNQVTVLNRRDDFSRAKAANLAAIVAAGNDDDVPLAISYSSSVAKFVGASDGSEGAGGQRGVLTIKTPSGEKDIHCDRVIARLGGEPARKFVESCGVKFLGDAVDAAPLLDGRYQSTVPGLYIIGALAGYPLIKQGMNQGYDVVEFINGNNIKPVDHSLLSDKFEALPYAGDVDDVLALYQKRVPMFSRLSPLAFRELVMDSQIVFAVSDEREFKHLQSQYADRSGLRLLKSGTPIHSQGDFGSSFFTIVEGDVKFSTRTKSGELYEFEQSPGSFFGDMSLLSGRPRSATAVPLSDAVIIETPRRVMLKLMRGSAEVSDGIEAVFTQRALQACFAPLRPYPEFRELAKMVSTKTLEAGHHVYGEGERGDCFYLIRSGSVTLYKQRGRQSITLGQRQAGQLLGQLALMGDPTRRETAIAAVRTELTVIDKTAFAKLVREAPDAVGRLQEITSEQLDANSRVGASAGSAEIMGFLMDQGLGEATNAMVIDESLCVGCDNCEIACAETHGGVSRLKRKEGQRFGEINLPVACRHCETPHCMKDCPPDAIHREPGGEVFIDDTCIGCGNCQANCPYGVISMAPPTEPKPSLLSWLLFGLGDGPGEAPPTKASGAIKKAVKCDACAGQKGGPACVRACPTGAAMRIGPEEYPALITRQS